LRLPECLATIFLFLYTASAVKREEDILDEIRGISGKKGGNPEKAARKAALRYAVPHRFLERQRDDAAADAPLIEFTNALQLDLGAGRVLAIQILHDAPLVDFQVCQLAGQRLLPMLARP